MMKSQVDPPPLILTLQLDDASFQTLDSLRRQYFPPERNFIPAHLTLFHALPEAELAMVRESLASMCAETPPMMLRLPSVRFLGRGTAVEVESRALLALRGELVRRWRPLLTAQDTQGFRPHVTIQNKVTPERARLVYEELAATWQELAVRGEGLLLWRYLGGPWELVERFGFGRSDGGEAARQK